MKRSDMILEAASEGKSLYINFGDDIDAAKRSRQCLTTERSRMKKLYERYYQKFSRPEHLQLSQDIDAVMCYVYRFDSDGCYYLCIEPDEFNLDVIIGPNGEREYAR